ncbi:MAG: aminotransferase class III-fold pyridoxal phosphate-dependent enzyme [Chloroflexi bacterium]|nr:aminotransferase class III-fold pyridoxal phosphate-dependent enzyme [Chloroflexota bacterium]
MGAWEPGAQGNTFGENPVACAAADATLDVIEEDRLIDNAARRAADLLAGLGALAQRSGAIAEVRGCGLMIGLEVVSGEAATRFRQGLLARRVIVSTRGARSSVVRLAPPDHRRGAVARLLESPSDVLCPSPAASLEPK